VAQVQKFRGDSEWNSPLVQILVVVAIIQVKKDRLKAEARRRVSYQQQMDMSESFLNYGGNLLNTNMVVYCYWYFRMGTFRRLSSDVIILIYSPFWKGNWLIFHVPIFMVKIEYGFRLEVFFRRSLNPSLRKNLIGNLNI